MSRKRTRKAAERPAAGDTAASPPPPTPKRKPRRPADENKMYEPENKAGGSRRT